MMHVLPFRARLPSPTPKGPHKREVHPPPPSHTKSAADRTRQKQKRGSNQATMVAPPPNPQDNMAAKGTTHARETPAMHTIGTDKMAKVQSERSSARCLESMVKTIRDHSYEGLVQTIPHYAPNMDARSSHWVHEKFNDALQQEMSLVLQRAQGPGARLTPWGHYQARNLAPTPGHYALVRTHVVDKYLEETPRKVPMQHRIAMPAPQQWKSSPMNEMGFGHQVYPSPPIRQPPTPWILGMLQAPMACGNVPATRFSP